MKFTCLTFIAFTLILSFSSSAQNINPTFDKFDHDGNGELDPSEFEDVL
jgi:hypothetical protein